MGCCASSVHKDSASALKLQIPAMPPEKVAADDTHSIPATPVKEKLPGVAVDPLPVQPVGYGSRVSPLNSSVTSYRSYGSKDEIFYDSQAWPESDCDDDFYSVKGDFTPSRSSTPAHSIGGTPRISRTFSPHVNKALFQARASSFDAGLMMWSHGSSPLHKTNSAKTPTTAAAAPAGIDDIKAAAADPPSSSAATIKRKKLADLFKESIRKRADETESADDHVKPNDHQLEKEKPLKSSLSCIPRLVSGRKKASSPPPSAVAVCA